MKKLAVLDFYGPNDIAKNKDKIIRNNAFIRPDGFFYLASGYTGSSPSRKLESSAQVIGVEYLGADFIEKYKRKYPFIFSRPNYYSSEEVVYLSKALNIPFEIIENNIAQNTLAIKKVRKEKEFDKIRTILIHFYGMALFARMEQVNTGIDNIKYYDHSVLPNPEWYGAKPTHDQITTMKMLMDLNYETGMDSSDVCIKKLKLHYDDSIWHT